MEKPLTFALIAKVNLGHTFHCPPCREGVWFALPHTQGLGFSGEAELGVCASVPLQDCSATRGPEKAVCTGRVQHCRACVCVHAMVRVCTCFHMQVWTAVMCSSVLNMQIPVDSVYCYYVWKCVMKNICISMFA